MALCCLSEDFTSKSALTAAKINKLAKAKLPSELPALRMENTIGGAWQGTLRAAGTEGIAVLSCPLCQGSSCLHATVQQVSGAP